MHAPKSINGQVRNRKEGRIERKKKRENVPDKKLVSVILHTTAPKRAMTYDSPGPGKRLALNRSTCSLVWKINGFKWKRIVMEVCWIRSFVFERSDFTWVPGKRTASLRQLGFTDQ